MTTRTEVTGASHLVRSLGVRACYISETAVWTVIVSEVVFARGLFTTVTACHRDLPLRVGGPTIIYGSVEVRLFRVLF